VNGFTLHATFDKNGKPDEAHLSSGDSGGAVFINDGGAWESRGHQLEPLLGLPFHAEMYAAAVQVPLDR
jgi:hypothetical protein